MPRRAKQSEPADSRLAPILEWLSASNRTPFPFQQRAWSTYLEGASGLIHAPTGMGKSLAAFLGPVAEFLAEPPTTRKSEPLRVLWVTPMRALATDTTRSLTEAAARLAPTWTVEKRTGDTSHAKKLRQRERLPTVLVTTPESLTLLLSYPGAQALFSSLRSIVVDEWHELLSTKRGTQTELALARLRRWTPAVRTWGLSATLGNLDEARSALMGPAAADRALVIPGDSPKQTNIRTLLPETVDRFPWSGHIGLRLLPEVLTTIESGGATLLFTNTRSQTEIWFRAIQRAKPEWVGQIALHHGSLDSAVRKRVEDMLRDGALRCVVCTSSLDLGVDFSPVDQIIHIGSPKGVARLLQRAGRSGHQPGAISQAICVPTHALEMLEFAAARAAAAHNAIEPRTPIIAPLDVLAQHLVTIACSEPFVESELLAEVRTTHAFHHLTDQEWQWCIEFVSQGGPALGAYPQYARISPDEAGHWRIASRAMATTHRLNIGAITSGASIAVKVMGGKTLGTVEESFVARLAPGDRFYFAGQVVELVRVRDMTAHVHRTNRVSGVVPRWGGSRSPLSSELAHAVREIIARSLNESSLEPEIVMARPLLELQAEWSRLPGGTDLLIERTQTREGNHAFLFPLQGRQVHEGLGVLLAHRLSKSSPMTISVTVNDYGIELLSRDPLPTDARTWRSLLDESDLLNDLLASLNASQLARRQFRDIARIAGLISSGFPGKGGGKTSRQLQASSELFFDVLSEFDPQSMLLDQSRREVLDSQLEVTRLRETLQGLHNAELSIVSTPTLTPFAFPLWAERMRTQYVTSERWIDRVNKMALRLETRADRSQRAKRARKQSTPAVHARAKTRERATC